MGIESRIENLRLLGIVHQTYFTTSVRSRMQYILAGLLLMIVYEVYLVVYYKYQDFQVNTYMASLEQENVHLYDRIEAKKSYFASVQTNAYIDRIMKASQNRKDPGEEVVFLVDEKSVSDYKSLDTATIIAERKTPSKTLGMNNREKWVYHLFGVDIRE